MKKFITHLILLAFCFLNTNLIFAQQLISEDFNFSGSLTSNGWTAHSAGGTSVVSTVTGLTYTGLPGSGIGNAALVNNAGGEDINRVFTAQSTDGQSVYVSLLVNVTDAATSKNGDYFFHIGDGGGISFTQFSARLFAKITASNVNFGISNTSTATYGTTNFSKNTTYLLIIKYDINVAGNDPVSLWVIPSGVPASEILAGSAEVTNIATAGQNNIQALGLRQGSGSNSVQVVVDAIKVGAAWADVTTGSSQPPVLNIAGTINNFGNVTVGSSSASQFLTLSGSNLSGAPGNLLVSAGPLTYFEFSLDNSNWSQSLNIPYTSPTLASTNLYIRFTPQTTGGVIENVTITGGGADTFIFNVSGNGVAPVTPVLTAGTLAAFGNVCLNSTTAPNSFTLNGVNLTTADIIIGPLDGFAFSTTSSGSYTPSLTINQTGGVFTHTVYVNFTPVAAQSYDGNIAISGAGAPSINVAASGAGANNAPAVTTGSSSNITTSTATLAGSITDLGCSAVTAYGIEYSTTNGFANGTGTAAVSTNLNAGAFTAALATLNPGTTYYYKAYATNAGGTAYGAQQSFITAVPVLTATPLTAFGSQCANSTTEPNSFTINSTGLSAADVTVGPLAGYSFSTTSGGTYTNSLTITHAAGAFTQAVFVKFTPVAIQSYNGNIPVGGGGANTINVAASGSGVNLPATVTTEAATAVSTQSATLNGTITGVGCSNITDYGIEFSGINDFIPGTGTKMFANNSNSSGVYSVVVNGLVQNTTYYFRSFATNAAGNNYGPQQSFTTTAIPDGLVLYNIPAQRNSALRFSITDIKPDHYGILILNSNGQLVYRKDIITQVNFINDQIIVPNNLTPGVYQFRLENYNGYRIKRTIVIQ